MILFLDFDGVLHPDDAYLVRGRPVLRAEGALFMWAAPLAALLDAHPQVQIVLSTSWARELGFSRARRFLPEALRARVIGATWHSAMAYNNNGDYRPRDRDTWWDRATRYQQIRRYVDRVRLADWIAVDDNPEGWADADRDRLVLTSSDRGLDDAATMARLRELLTAASWAGPLDTRVIITREGEHLVARLSDGRVLRHPDTIALADMLLAAGVTADDVQMPDWREGDIAPMVGERIVLFHRMRQAQLPL